MYTCLAVLLSVIRAVHLLEVNASYTTPFQCRDGSYAFITGTDLTLQYDYGYQFAKVYSFHLYEVFTGRHLFDYESVTGQAYIKDNRLKSYEWTDKGIRFIITDIVKEKDQGKYLCDMVVGAEYKEEPVVVKEIFDPPAEMKLNTPSGVNENFFLKKGFGEYVLNASAQPYAAIDCSSVKITWVSPSKGNLRSCRAEDVRDPTVCPLILKESDMTDECVALAVYAEQYGVRSKNKTYTICYYSTNEPPASDDGVHTIVIVGEIIGVLVLLSCILVLVIVYLKRELARIIRKARCRTRTRTLSNQIPNNNNKAEVGESWLPTAAVKAKEQPKKKQKKKKPQVKQDKGSSANVRSNPELKAPAAVKPKSATAKASYHGKYGVMAESSSSSEEHFSMELQPISGGNEGRVENWDSEVPTPEMSQEDAMLPSQATQDFENNMGLDDFGYSGYAGYGGTSDLDPLPSLHQDTTLAHSSASQMSGISKSHRGM